MPGEPTTARAVPRFLAAAVVLVAVGTAAACSSPSSSATSGTTSGTPSSTAPSLGPWKGSLVASTLPAPIQSLRAVTCPTAQRCWAVGSTTPTTTAPSGPTIVGSTDGGATWTAETVPATVGYLSAIACASVRSCTAVGQIGQTGVGPGAVLATADGGATWVLQSVPAGTSDVTAVACRPGGRCTALGVLAGRVTTLVPSTTGTWLPTGALPPAASVATALSCIDATDCWATSAQAVDVSHVIGVIAVTADGGDTWTLQHVPVGTGALQGIDCTPGTPVDGRPADAAAASCTAVGTTATVLGAARTGQGVVLTSADGGASWASDPVTPTSADLLAVSCGAGPCVAVGTAVASTPAAGLVVLTASGTRPGTSWRSAAVAPVALPLTGVACVSLSSCVVVGESVSARLAAA